MNTIKLKRGKHENLPVLAIGEPAFTTDTKELYIGTATGNVKISADIDEINAILVNYVTNATFNVLENRVSSVETNKVSTTTFNQQLLLKQETKPNGVDSLMLGNKINPVYMDDLFVTDVFVVANQSAMLALDAQRGDFAVRTDVGKTFVLKQSPATTLANWVELQTTSDVVSVNGKTGAVTIEISDLSGLQAALNAKVEVVTYESEQQAQDTLIANKVDKVSGKGLSTNDYTTTEKNKLNGIDMGAQVNVQSDWDAASGDAFILNKPTIPTNNNQLTNGAGYITGYIETDPIFTAWDKSTGISITKSQVSDLLEATQSLSGLMSATDKQRLDVLHSLLEEDTANNIVDSINEVLEIFNNYPEGADLVTALSGKVDKVSGKGLSTNDYTTTEKNKLNGIDMGAQVNTVTSVAGKTGAVVLAKADVGLGSVQNYAIASKTQAESGTSNVLYMTPLRTKELISVVMGDIESALDAILGV